MLRLVFVQLAGACVLLGPVWFGYGAAEEPEAQSQEGRAGTTLFTLDQAVLRLGKETGIRIKLEDRRKRSSKTQLGCLPRTSPASFWFGVDEIERAFGINLVWSTSNADQSVCVLTVTDQRHQVVSARVKGPYRLLVSRRAGGTPGGGQAPHGSAFVLLQYVAFVDVLCAKWIPGRDPEGGDAAVHSFQYSYGEVRASVGEIMLGTVRLEQASKVGGLIRVTKAAQRNAFEITLPAGPALSKQAQEMGPGIRLLGFGRIEDANAWFWDAPVNFRNRPEAEPRPAYLVRLSTQGVGGATSSPLSDLGLLDEEGVVHPPIALWERSHHAELLQVAFAVAVWQGEAKPAKVVGRVVARTEIETLEINGMELGRL